MHDRPRSLLQLTGAPIHPSPLAAAALVIIDAQLEYVSGRLPLAGIDAAVAEARSLLALARRHEVPVFHVVHHARPGAPVFDPNGPNVAIIAALAPQPGEEIVVKRLPNAFAGTSLHQQIQATGRRELILAGFMTHNCVSSSARAALDLGYRTTVVAAATATRDLPDPISGGTTPAAITQNGTLAALADRIAIVIPDATAWTRP